jgi:hypothetical protein
MLITKRKRRKRKMRRKRRGRNKEGPISFIPAVLGNFPFLLQI